MNNPAFPSLSIRQILVALAALLFVGSVQAEWISLGRTDNFRVYLEQNQLRRNGDVVQTWQLMDFTSAQWVDERTVVGSIKNLTEYDCSQPRFCTLLVEAYSEQMAEGRLVAKEQLPDPPWEGVEAGGTAEKIWRAACSKK